MDMRRLSMIAVLLLLLGTACDTTSTTTDRQTTATTTGSPTTTASPSTTRPTPTTNPPTTPPTDRSTVWVYFSFGDGTDCGMVKGFERAYDGTDAFEAAFQALVGGPTDEEIAAGAGSFFSAETSGTVSSALISDGVLSVDFADFRDRLNNASTSCGSEALLSQLTATAFQFPEVDSAIFSINGSCSTFFNWLQRECQVIDAPGTSSGATNDLASGSGCTPGTDELPDGRWFGFVATATATTVEFDLACWFGGSAAIRAAAEDQMESPPPNDYYIRNESSQLREVAVSATANANWMKQSGDPNTAHDTDYVAWVAEVARRATTGEWQPGVWLTIENGVTTLVTEQYVP